MNEHFRTFSEHHPITFAIIDERRRLNVLRTPPDHLANHRQTNTYDCFSNTTRLLFAIKDDQTLPNVYRTPSDYFPDRRRKNTSERFPNITLSHTIEHLPNPCPEYSPLISKAYINENFKHHSITFLLVAIDERS